MKIKQLVIDTGAFVKNVPIWDYAEEFFTVIDVIKEIKDKHTRRLIDALPIKLQITEPTPESIRFIIEFTKKTGDYTSLSLADIKVLALTYELEVKAKGGSEHLRSEPLEIRTQEIASVRPPPSVCPNSELEGFYIPSKNKKKNEEEKKSTKEGENDETGKKEEVIDAIETGLQSLEVTEKSDEVNGRKNSGNDSENNESGFDSEDGNSSDYEEYEEVEEEEEEESEENDNNGEDDDDEDDDDDDEGWITPSNIKSFKNPSNVEDLPADVVTACITADYAVQNTVKHIGLKVLGVDGKLISNVRTFILRCHACFKCTDKMDKIFCPHCGNKTLKRVSVTSNSDGTQKIWISTKRPINIRGTKFSLPRPRGGKHGINPILVADQREVQQRATRLGRMKNDPLAAEYDPANQPFVTRDIYSRSAILGVKTGSKQHRGTFYWEQRNPNVPMKKGSSRRKK